MTNRKNKNSRVAAPSVNASGDRKTLARAKSGIEANQARGAPGGERGRALERMKHRLKTRKGRKLYGKRKQTVEPLFGIIKSVMRLRQFLLRGLASVRGEWTLVTMAWNTKWMAVVAG